MAKKQQSAEEAFLRDVCEHPAEDAPRLVPLAASPRLPRLIVLESGRVERTLVDLLKEHGKGLELE